MSRDLGDLLGAETVSARRQMEIRCISTPRSKPDGKKRRIHLSRQAMEQTILESLQELQITDLLDGASDTAERLSAVRARLEEVTEQLEKVEAAILDNGNVATLAKVAKKLEAKQKTLTKQEEDLAAELSTSATDTLADLQDLITRLRTDKGDDLTALRAKLKARLRETVKFISVDHIEERSCQDRTVFLGISFHHFPHRIRYVEAQLKTCPTGGVDVVSRTGHFDFDKHRKQTGLKDLRRFGDDSPLAG